MFQPKDIIKDIETIREEQKSMAKNSKDLNNAHENWMNKAKNQQKDLEQKHMSIIKEIVDEN